MKNKTEQAAQGSDKELFTPGPWKLQGPKIQKDMDNQTYWTIMPDPYKSKADPYKAIGFYYPYSGLTKEEQEANATLIASAPRLQAENNQLREALQIAKNYVENFIAKGGIGEAQKDLSIINESLNHIK